MPIHATDNPFPSVLFQETEAVDLDANPSSGQRRLIVDPSDHLLYLVDPSGTPSLVGGVSGLTDPMTTRGDIIIRNASNATARLGRGSAGQVLQSDGTDIAWQTPSAGSLTCSMAQLSGNVTMTTNGTYYDGPTLSLAAGTWLLVASIAISSGSNATVTGKIWDGTTDLASAVAFCVAGGNVTLAMTCKVTPGSTTTYRAAATSQVNGNTILAAAGFNGVGNNVSTLTALKVA